MINYIYKLPISENKIKYNLTRIKNERIVTFKQSTVIKLKMHYEMSLDKQFKWVYINFTQLKLNKIVVDNAVDIL
jgi:hypothetical protein